MHSKVDASTTCKQSRDSTFVLFSVSLHAQPVLISSHQQDIKKCLVTFCYYALKVKGKRYLATMSCFALILVYSLVINFARKEENIPSLLLFEAWSVHSSVFCGMCVYVL